MAAPTLPPISLSSGPAISGGPTSSGPISTGDFLVDRRGGTAEIVRYLIIAAAALGAVWIYRR